MTNQENGVDLKSAAVTEEKKLFIETYGCQMNVADSEVVWPWKASSSFRARALCAKNPSQRFHVR